MQQHDFNIRMTWTIGSTFSYSIQGLGSSSYDLNTLLQEINECQHIHTVKGSHMHGDEAASGSPSKLAASSNSINSQHDCYAQILSMTQHAFHCGEPVSGKGSQLPPD